MVKFLWALALVAASLGRSFAADTAALITPLMILDGGWRLEAGAQLPFGVAPAAGGRLRFVQPVGVAARGDVVMVADAGARTLWRLERQRDAMRAFAPFTGMPMESGASLQLGEDFSTWVALPSEHRVVQYDARGRLVRQWSDEISAARPVAVAVPPDRSEIVVADAMSSRIVTFDRLGLMQRRLGSADVLQSVGAMTFGPDGLYVVDRLGQQVLVLDASGTPRAQIGEHQLTQPRALAVDRYGRVFVSDDAQQRIMVFRGERLLASFGGRGVGPGRFGRIEALAADGNLLYVADSVNARVQVLLVAPPSMEESK